MGLDNQHEIKTLKANDPSLMRSLEWAIVQGTWILIENIGKDLDPSLEPILL